MAMRMFLIYVLVELAVVVGLVSAVGFGWTVLAIMVTFVVGLALAGSQVARHLARLQSALNSRSASGALATDSALVALGAVLVVIPGLASSLLGALLLLPPTRRIARPVAIGLVGRKLAATPVVTVYPGGFGRGQRPAPDYVEGEVIDVVDVGGSPSMRPDPTALEHRVIRND
ncbi:FxsA family protein [Mycolicibacterium neoaurum]|uniref:FxsA family protein n=1 Tax=Mycolicibacterium neoaurum TaxID=1795 RepID=UPI00267107C3|nr:FxsA family protein [Mycolicibacterium neoaurum]MDO3399093.1 FxsA family protein [Mycolicibacterium neoaurum]